MIDIEGYKLIHDDYPEYIKRGGICMYYKESLPVQIINQDFLKEALLLKISYNDKNVSFIYRASQSTDEFDSFLSNFENCLNYISKRKPSLSVSIGNFNLRSSSSWSKLTDTIKGFRGYY